jgi:hypothetical protein
MAKEIQKTSAPVGHIPQSEEEMKRLFDGDGAGVVVHFDRPLVSYKRIKHNLVEGYLLGRKLLNLPKGQEDLREYDENTPPEEVGKFGAYVIELTKPCKAMVGDKEEIIPVGREVYVCETAKLKELVTFIDGRPAEITAIRIMQDGTQFLKGGFEMQNYRIRADVLPAKPRVGYHLTFLRPAAIAGHVDHAAIPAGHGTHDLKQLAGNSSHAPAQA